MKTYYIFNIKEEFKALYINNTSSLYKMLNSIRILKYDEIGVGFSFLKQLTKKMEKLTLDNYLYIKMHRFAFYSKNKNIHYYSDGALDEVSTLEVMNGYIKITTNKEIPVFLKILKNYSDDFFICDFINTNFYFIESIKKLV